MKLFPYFDNKVLIQNLLVYVLLLPMFILSFKLLHERSFMTLVTERKKINWLRFWTSFASWGFISLLMFAIPILITPEEYTFNFQLIPFLELILICLTLVFIKVFFLTVFLRSYLLQLFIFLVKSPIISLLLTVVLFAFLMNYNKSFNNINYVMLMHYIILGSFLGIIIILDDGLEIVIGMSLVSSLISILFVGNRTSPYKTYSLYIKDSFGNEDYLVYIACFISYPFYLYFLSRVYNWKNWKEKLFDKVKKPIEV